jgi:adenine-specific DNA methylase
MKEVRGARRFVDLFCGSSVVSWYVSRNIKIPVLAVDLQRFAAVLARAVLERTEPLNDDQSWPNWQKRSEAWLIEGLAKEIKKARLLSDEYNKRMLRRHIVDARKFCSAIKKAPVTNAYGGYYYSPLQALQIDALRATLPYKKPVRDVALASLLEAASQCAAAPGHTAQPFGNTPTAREWIKEAWSRDVLTFTKRAFSDFATYHAKERGSVRLGDANRVARSLKKNDLAFVDPPYSNVQYSRFYHVLETITRGQRVEITGTGRYPNIKQRPQSNYSLKGKSRKAFDDLLSNLANRKVRCVLTFPVGNASNGLSGGIVERLARKYFLVSRKTVKSHFSTLGGNGTHRKACLHTPELILVLTPKSPYLLPDSKLVTLGQGLRT